MSDTPAGTDRRLAIETVLAGSTRHSGISLPVGEVLPNYREYTRGILIAELGVISLAYAEIR